MSTVEVPAPTEPNSAERSPAEARPAAPRGGVELDDRLPHLARTGPGDQVPAARGRVVMLVRNTVEYDTRVRKEARSLRADGWDVHVIGTKPSGGAEYLEMDGVPVHRPLLVWRYFRLERMHVYRQEKRRRVRNDRLARMKLASDRAAAATATGMRAKAVRKARAALRRFGRIVVRRRANLAITSSQRFYELRRSLFRSRRSIQDHLDYALQVRPLLVRLRPEVIHANDLDTLWAAWSYARRTGARVVYDAHELETHRNKPYWSPGERLIVRTVESFLIRRCDAVITVSDAIADELVRMYRIPRPAVVLNSPPAAAAELARPEVDLRARLGLTAAHRLAVYVGGIRINRGIETLTRSLLYLPETWHAAVVGPRDRGDLPILSLAKELGVQDRLHLVDPVPAATVPAFIRGADVAVSPILNACLSYDLALPNKLFDAVFARLPIVVSGLREMSSFVRRHDVGAIFDESDPVDLARVLVQTEQNRPAGLDDDAAMAELIRSVSWERQEETLRALYRAFADEPAAEAPADPAA
jgi:glycosyltransferase involved in cell wall biosynthesis